MRRKLRAARLLVLCGPVLIAAAAALFVESALQGFAWAPALAQDQPSLKELLGRAQSQSERKAVEDLIGKLQSPPGKAPEPAAKAPAAAPAAAASKEPSPAVAAPAPMPGAIPDASPKASREPAGVATAPPQPQAPDKPAAPTPPPVASNVPAISPDAAVKSAEQKELPSVDLEVFFAYGSSQVTPQAATMLATLGRALTDARLAGGSFLIAGHTDAKGGASYNLGLSQQRAESVRRFLIANFAIDQDRLVAKGYGQQRLKNAAKPFAAENRRVQIVNVTKP